MSDPALKAAVLALPAADRLELIGDLTDSLENTIDSMPFTEAQELELERRDDEMDRDPQLGSSWEAVKARAWPGQ